MHAQKSAGTAYYGEIAGTGNNVQGLRVVARTSAFQFRKRSLDIRNIGRQLGVGTVLEGSLRKYGARLRITVQLNDTRTGLRLRKLSMSDSSARPIAIK